jgi:hypothetical protein
MTAFDITRKWGFSMLRRNIRVDLLIGFALAGHAPPRRA